MPDQMTKEQREAKWWADWWAEDYTWDGLTKKPLHGWVVADGALREADTGRHYGQPLPEAPAPLQGADATLQDYWRADPATGRLRSDHDMASELVSVPTQPIFHRIHLPLQYFDRTTTGKSDWANEDLNEIITPRLRAATEKILAESSAVTSIGLVERQAQLCGAVLLHGLSHQKGHAAPLSVNCTNTAFVRSAHFDDSTFAGDTHFVGANFIGDARFFGVCFGRNVSFVKAQFSGAAYFHSATFKGEAIFDSACFVRQAGFDSVTFERDARFVRVHFLGHVNFDDAAFRSKAAYEGAKFDCATQFRRCLFAELVWFDDARFGHPDKSRDMDFTASIFQALASFERIRWPDSGPDWHQALNQVLFQGTLNLTGAGFKAFAAFDGATFERGLQVDEVDEKSAKATFNSELAAALLAAEVDGEQFKAAELEKRKEAIRSINDTQLQKQKKRDDENSALISKQELKAYVSSRREVRLRQLERGCRVLKQAMGEASDRTREQLLYRFELQARRAQRKLPAGEKLFSYLYDWTSDYGASMRLPFFWLGLVSGLFTGIYALGTSPLGLAPDAPLNWDVITDSAKMSAARVFPFGAFEDESKDWLKAYEAEHGAGWGLLMRIAGSFQSALALALVFVFGLAVRRRFQIS